MPKWLQNLEFSTAHKFSIFLITLLVTLAFFNFYFITHKQKDYALLINTSGKQRMLFVQVQLALEYIKHEPSESNYRNLETLLLTMQQEYRFIRSALHEIEFKQTNIYTSGYKNTVLEDLYAPALLLQHPADKRTIARLLNHRTQILQELNRPVEQLQNESDQLIERIIQQEAGLFIIILAILGITSLLIIKPLLKQLKNKHRSIQQLNNKLEQRVHERTKKLEKTLDIVNQYVYSSYTDACGIITNVTDAFCELSGYSRDELIGKTHAIIKNPDNISDTFTSLWNTILKGETFSGIIKNRRKNGEDYWLDSYIIPDINDQGTILGFQAYRRDITEKKKLEILNNELEERVIERTKEIERIAVTDLLTGLFNRHRFNQDLTDALAFYSRYHMPITIAIFDIDHFKNVNDTYGHNTGDDVLVAFSKILQKHMRQTDKLARWGGEEFVLLLINTELQDGVSVAKNLLERIQQHSFGTVGSVTCSIGLSTLKAGDTPKTFLNRADAALYRAKHEGRNQVCYE